MHLRDISSTDDRIAVEFCQANSPTVTASAVWAVKGLLCCYCLSVMFHFHGYTDVRSQNQLDSSFGKRFCQRILRNILFLSDSREHGVKAQSFPFLPTPVCHVCILAVNRFWPSLLLPSPAHPSLDWLTVESYSGLYGKSSSVKKQQSLICDPYIVLGNTGCFDFGICMLPCPVLIKLFVAVVLLCFMLLSLNTQYLSLPASAFRRNWSLFIFESLACVLRVWALSTWLLHMPGIAF